MLVGLDLPSASGELKQASNPRSGQLSESEEKHLRQSERADLWQPKCNGNQTVLASDIHTRDRDTGPLAGTEAGSWSLGIVEQSQGEGYC